MTVPPEDDWPAPDAPTRVAPAPPEPPVPPPADRRIGAGMLFGLGAIALVVIGFAIAWFLTHRHHHHGQPTTVVVTQQTTGQHRVSIAVPDVRHLKLSAATSVLRSVGLQAQTNGAVKGTVSTQSPAAGTKVARGSDVLLGVTAAKPGATTTIQTTTAQTTTAQTTTAQTTTAQTTTAAPPPQPTSATVPDLSGKNESSAATALGNAGLLASLVFVPSSDELGTVEAQGKPAGTSVPYHSHVQVNVSTGPGQKPMETVPNVIGKPLQQALATINAAHLRLIYLRYPVTTKAQAGKIVQQTPLAGAKAPQNAQVIVYMGAFKG